MTQQINIHKENGNLSHELWWTPIFSLQKDLNDSLRQTHSNFLHPSFSMPALWEAEENMFNVIQHNTHRLFSEMFNNRQMTTPWLTGAMTEPYVDIIENGSTFKIQADVPGLNVEDLDVSISDTTITIDGARKEVKTDNGDTYIRHECHCGNFSRTIALPNEVNVDGAKASFDQNVLTIVIPKKVETSITTRKLNVEVDQAKKVAKKIQPKSRAKSHN